MIAIRPFWFTVGICAVALAFAGAVLPLLPTTPFLLVAAFAFARSSPRFHAWLLDHPTFGPLIENWNRHGAIDRRTKLIAMAVIVAAPLLTLLLGVPLWVLLAQIAVLACVSVFILTRPEHDA